MEARESGQHTFRGPCPDLLVSQNVKPLIFSKLKGFGSDKIAYGVQGPLLPDYATLVN